MQHHGQFWLSDTPDRCSNTWGGCYRICTWMEFAEPSFFFFNTHLDERKDPTPRLKSINLIKKKIRGITAGLPAVLAGDFNFTRESEEYNAITGYLRDSYLIGGDEDKEKSITYHGYKGFTKVNKHAADRRFIDFIFCSDHFTVLRSTVIHDNSGVSTETCPSDHWPVLAELSLD